MRATSIFFKYLKAFPYYIYGIFVAIFHLIQPTEESLEENNSSDVNEFIKYFELKYGKNRPSFNPSDYISCVNKAKSSLKYLLIYLHGDDHEDTDYFCRNVLCSPLFLEYLQIQNFIFWGCNINSSEGFSVSKIIREHYYPFIGIVAINTNERMYLVARSEGLMTVEECIAFIDRSIETNSLGMAVHRAAREEKEKNNLKLRLEQEDVQRKRSTVTEQRNGQIETNHLKNHSTRQQCEMDNDDNNKISCWDFWKVKQKKVRSLLPPEPSLIYKPPHIVVFKIKFPSGSLVQRRFYLTDSIKLLFYTIFCSEDCPRNFRVFSNFPKREILCRPVNFEWESGFTEILRHPRQSLCDPPNFNDADLNTNTYLFVLDMDL